MFHRVGQCVVHKQIVQAAPGVGTVLCVSFLSALFLSFSFGYVSFSASAAKLGLQEAAVPVLFCVSVIVFDMGISGWLF